MAISGVDPKCYILALFVRDDGVRFLLGDDPYEFKDKQLHFQPNTIANDVVEVQGNDGYLLAGQVRRPGTQSFDGYVGNGTNSKAEVEAKRRDFLQFFRRSHFYKVIYVFPNGTAIQRKQGFLVDDPTVQELYQQYPEYHVALNFEDVNYYTYEEDDEGHEIYAEEAIIRLVGGGATGGLIWDENGVVWESPWGESTTVTGTDFQVDNLLPVRVPISEVELQGDTYQQTYSGKNLMNYNTYDADNGRIMNMPNLVLPVGTFTMSFDLDSFSMGTASSMNVIIYLIDENNQSAFIDGAGSKNLIVINSSTQLGRYTFTFETKAITHYSSTNIRLSVAAYDNGARCKLSNIQIESGSTATAYEPYTGGPSPNPEYPQAVQTVTGEQTVKVSDGGSNTQTFTIDLGATELCKIGDYQDYIYKSGGDWYVHKETGGQDITSVFSLYSSAGEGYIGGIKSASDMKANSRNNGFCNKLTPFYSPSGAVTEGITFGAGSTNQNIYIILQSSRIANNTVEGWNTYLGSNPMTVYYPLATPTDTQITDADLVAQLEALDGMTLFVGENNILVSATSPNLPATLEFSYYTQYLTPYGAEWEEGGTKGPTIVDVNAIDNTYPVWELTGPAINPTLSVLTTNTTLTYNGTITASQTLVIDMFNKTATLNGTSVIGNVSGDWVYMAPGTNRVAYTAGNTDAPDSKISWQEVVG